jgi:hypothetical protein
VQADASVPIHALLAGDESLTEDDLWGRIALYARTGSRKTGLTSHVTALVADLHWRGMGSVVVRAITLEAAPDLSLSSADEVS